MDVMEAIYNRRSVRAYTDQPVDRATVESLIKAAIHAPSSMNEQGTVSVPLPCGRAVVYRLCGLRDRARPSGPQQRPAGSRRRITEATLTGQGGKRGHLEFPPEIACPP